LRVHQLITAKTNGARHFGDELTETTFKKLRFGYQWTGPSDEILQRTLGQGELGVGSVRNSVKNFRRFLFCDRKRNNPKTWASFVGAEVRYIEMVLEK
jgi:hypothetical protein